MRQKVNKSKVFAIVDIGSVAIRFEIYTTNISESRPISSSYKLIHAERLLPKLGNLDLKNNISKESTVEACRFLEKISRKLKSIDYDKVIAVGTAVFRDASNSESTIALLEKSLEQKITVLSSNDEARIIAEGITNFEKNLPDSYLLLDIGGRSSETSHVKSKQIVNSFSFNLGAISIRNAFFKDNKPTVEEIAQTRLFLRKQFSIYNEIFKDKSPTVVGSSGTLRMLGRFHKHINPKQKLIEKKFSHDIFEILDDPTNKHAKELFELEKNRTELVFSGIIIIQEFLNCYNINEIKISNYSLRHGLLSKYSEELRP